MSIDLTDSYWDCECETDYIHPKSVRRCPICNADADNQPDSRVEEVQKHFPNGFVAKAKVVVFTAADFFNEQVDVAQAVIVVGGICGRIEVCEYSFEPENFEAIKEWASRIEEEARNNGIPFESLISFDEEE